MNLSDFEEYVEPVILERGEEYFELGAVVKLANSGLKWDAIVSGSEDYNVAVELDGDNEIVRETCNCPYDRTPICKHKVAVFLAINAKLNDEDLPEPAVPPPDIHEILESLNKDQLIEIIEEHAQWSHSLSAKILAGYNNSGMSKPEYKKIVASSLNFAKRRGGFIPWDRTNESCSGADSVLNKARELLSHGNFRHALAAAQAVFEKLIPALQFADDSDGLIGGSIQTSLEIMHNASKCKLDEPARKEFFAYLIKNWDHKRLHGWVWGIELLEMAVNVHSGEKEADRVLEAVDSLFKDTQKINDFYWCENTSYQLKYSALLKTGHKTEAETFFQNNRNIPEFRRMAIEKAHKQNDLDTVRKLAKEGIEHDAKIKSLVDEWKKSLFLVYEQNKETENLRKLSLEFFFEGRFEYYETYKRTFPPEKWRKHCQKLIKKLFHKADPINSYRYALGYLLSKEGRLEELLSLVQTYPRLISEYEHLLIPDYPEEMYKINIDFIRQEAESANNRNAYWRLCNYSLKHLHDIGGREHVVKLIEEFREEYPQRPAMQDEIDKFEKKLEK